jgi:DNA-binding transcriptional regulator YiaG
VIRLVDHRHESSLISVHGNYKWIRSASTDVGHLDDACTHPAQQLASCTRCSKRSRNSGANPRTKQPRSSEYEKQSAHPYEPDIAIKIFCWLESDRIVIVLVRFNKAKLGDLWYTSASEQKPCRPVVTHTPIKYGRTVMTARAPASSSQPGDPTDVAFGRVNERLSRMLVKPGMREAVATRRAEMRDADRAHAMGLAALRKAAELTQTELAEALGISQAAVAKTEQREDLLLSTLNAYIEALGGQAHIVITFNGDEVDLNLGALRLNAETA